MLLATLHDGVFQVAQFAAVAEPEDHVVNDGFASIDYLSILIGTVLPLLVGLVTQRVTDPGVKAILLLVLSAVTSFLVEWQNGGADFQWEQTLVTTIATFVTAVAMYAGIWKPTRIGAAVQDTGGFELKRRPGA